MVVDWLEESVRAENDFGTPNLNPVESDLTVYPGQIEGNEDGGEGSVDDTAATADTADTEPALTA